MNSQRGIVGCLLLVCALQVSAQVKTYKYRINLRDKAETTYTLDNPSAYLSGRAMERRTKQGLPVDSTDLPVCRTYIHALAEKGAQPVSTSKWNNTVKAFSVGDGMPWSSPAMKVATDVEAA